MGFALLFVLIEVGISKTTVYAKKPGNDRSKPKPIVEVHKVHSCSPSNCFSPILLHWSSCILLSHSSSFSPFRGHLRRNHRLLRFTASLPSNLHLTIASLPLSNSLARSQTARPKIPILRRLHSPSRPLRISLPSPVTSKQFMSTSAVDTEYAEFSY